MANRSWNFDGKEIIGTHGAVVQWEDHKFFKLTYNGQVFNGELLDDASESNELFIKINHREFRIKKKGELDDLIARRKVLKAEKLKSKEQQRCETAQTPMPAPNPKEKHGKKAGRKSARDP